MKQYKDTVLTGYVYTIHFLEPHYHAKHYTGAIEVNRPEDRFNAHRLGSYGSSRLIRVLNELGKDYVLARVWKTGYPQCWEFEKKLKNRKGMARYCPFCTPEKNWKYRYSIRPSTKPEVDPGDELFYTSQGMVALREFMPNYFEELNLLPELSLVA